MVQPIQNVSVSLTKLRQLGDKANKLRRGNVAKRFSTRTIISRRLLGVSKLKPKGAGLCGRLIFVEV
ncbi:hypothetical protein T4B_3927 [Trichinella pseudospiralis]|uniref:Uncharacterized protein n=2 Tax=Trichinella pseudospiralis TaxID=6337 RepID=A0A0V1G4S6_TRIPS|nr:hypothetical protein T4E_11573 [Trichinella pseudospiralis]KRY78756.1 hypothetical protein T4A_10138 [Trichinella pseudospiralis]KRY93125.1 hypothetical protein T4D_11489 [Trichinella pseudospiralis]KRZ32895.1 hypothetical protein T4B_3927 [Trichinella pseudospiralis]KRZ46203.1 hypothetical protein T4C_9342 [Trichinella pseudospiralis]